METFLSDLRYALRGLRASPGFTITALLALALGIGANTAVFSVVNALLFRPPPGVRDFDRIASIYTSDFSGPPFGSSSYLDIQDYAAGTSAFSGVAAYAMRTAVLHEAEGGRPAELVGGQAVTGNYFDVLGTTMALGRGFAIDERRPGGPSAVVLTHAFWQTRLGGDLSVVGSTMRISGTPFTVVGVAPAGFNGLLPVVIPSFFVPLETSTEVFGMGLEDRGSRGLFTIGRLADGVTPEQANSQLTAVAGGLFRSYPEAWTDRLDQSRRVTVIPAMQALVPPQVRGPATAFAAVLMAVVGAVLLICCANLANLLLVRATARQREIGVRLALGAGRTRVIRQLITESMLLAGVGAVGGVGLAYAGTYALGNVRLPLPIPVRVDATPDLLVLGFAVLVSLLAGLLFGLAPALIATRGALTSSIGADRAAGGSTGRQMGLRYALAGGQIAVAVALLVMAGLLVRSLRSAQAMDPGFATDGMLFVNMAEDESTTPSELRLAFHRELRDQVAALPGVRSVSYVSYLPLGPGAGRRGFVAEGYTPAPQEEMEINFTEGGPAYLEAMGIPLRAGRDFSDVDGPGAPRVAIVNEAFARRYFAGASPIGKRLNVGRPSEAEIVGVATDGKYRTLGEEPLPFVHLALDQTSSPVVTLVVQAPGQLNGLDDAVRRLVAENAPDVAITSVATADQHLSITLLPQRAGSAALGLFGLLGLALSALGVYGVTSYTVERRAHEIGVRLALGAARGDVVRMIVGKGMAVALAGAVLGLAAAAGLSRLLGFLLFGIEPLDAVSFLVAAAVVASASLLANWLPARRSARLSPASILKGE